MNEEFFDDFFGEIEKIIEQEGGDFFTKATIDLAEIMGIELMLWNSIEDVKLCDVCERHTDTVKVVGDYRYLYPPAHFFCRCFLTPISREEAVYFGFDEENV